MKVSCLIVDDEPRAHNVLKHYIDRLNNVSLSGSAYNAVEGYEFLKKHPVDLILLDVNMPEIDGFSLLEMLDTKPMVIMTTAYTDHAFKSYEYNALDYLHKPIRFEKFVKAIEKACKWKAANTTPEVEKTLELKIDGALQKIETHDILYIESLGNYTKIKCRNKDHMLLATMKFFEQKLANSSFLRIHKSYIVNFDYVHANGETYVTLDKTTLPIGKTYKKYIQQYKASKF